MMQPGYYPDEAVVLTERMRTQIVREVRAVEPGPTTNLRHMAAGARVGLGLRASDDAQRAGAERLQRRYPELGALGARRIVRGVGVAAYERQRRERQEARAGGQR